MAEARPRVAKASCSLHGRTASPDCLHLTAGHRPGRSREGGGGKVERQCFSSQDDAGHLGGPYIEQS